VTLLGLMMPEMDGFVFISESWFKKYGGPRRSKWDSDVVERWPGGKQCGMVRR
jgi:hypothetical protein